MREYGNLYCDLSAGSGLNAFKRDPEYAAKFIEEFADRILFGYDICWIKNIHQFEANEFFEKMLDDGYISAENYGKIMRYNAVKLLGLDE
jgi:predicted TIM-barrel fold metal-dependent hydrolase